MISDVLSDAVFQIEEYQREMPDVYSGSLGEWVERVRKEMEQLRVYLDTPPYTELKPPK